MDHPLSLPHKKQLLKTIITRAILAIIFLMAIFFIPAGTFSYWQAWIYLGIILIPMCFVLRYFWKHDPALLERRMRYREKEKPQKLIVIVVLPLFLLAFLIPGLDFRFNWSMMPAWLVIVADLLCLAGYGLVILVFKANSYASRIIEVEKEQKVISSGPYAVVRHPMYVGSLLMYIASPLALGSYWALIPALVIIPFIIMRIRNEEKVLLKNLPGYKEYTQKTRYRLIPCIW